MKQLDPSDIEFGGPARYRIVVCGKVAAGWAERLAGLEITVIDRGDGEPWTQLTGPIRDQAELRGVLDTLYGLHLPIVEVETVGET